MKAETWDDERTRCFGMLLDGRAQVSEIKRRGEDATLLIGFNAHHDVVKFALPPCAEFVRLEPAFRHRRFGAPCAEIQDRRCLRGDRALDAAL